MNTQNFITIPYSFYPNKTDPIVELINLMEEYNKLSPELKRIKTMRTKKHLVKYILV